jgi:hypothetical protein
MLVVPELGKEIAMRNEHAHMRQAIADARDALIAVERELAALELELFPPPTSTMAAAASEAADASAREVELRESLVSAKALLAERVLAYHRKFHPHWGQLFKTGYQNSRFAQQVENYACLYTARATHLGMYSPRTRFHTTVDDMPHDRL